MCSSDLNDREGEREKGIVEMMQRAQTRVGHVINPRDFSSANQMQGGPKPRIMCFSSNQPDARMYFFSIFGGVQTSDARRLAVPRVFFVQI